MSEFSYTIRSVQLDLARQMETVGFIKEFTDFAARNGYNSLTLYLEGRIRTPGFPYPEKAESYTTDQMAEVVAYAADRDIDVIPVVSTLGHAELFLRYPELAHLAETRGGVSGRFEHCPAQVFCPSQEDTYRFFRDYLSEICRIFPSPYFHVGCDETWDMGSCELCVDRLRHGESQADIYAKHLLDVHRIITGELGKRMIIWDDMFEFYPGALEKLPHDIILACWQYHDRVEQARGHFLNGLRVDSLAEYDRLGFQYLICPSDYTHTIHNAESFTSYGAKHRPLGGLMTTWEKSDSFLLQSMPLIACVGRLWASGRAGDCDKILREVIEEIFGLDDEIFYFAIKALCSSGLYLERRIRLDDYLTCGENNFDYSRRRLVEMLLAILPAYRDKAVVVSRPILEEILLSLRSEQIATMLEDLVPRFFKDRAPLIENGQKLRQIRALLAEVSAERIALWRRVRPGISPAKMEAHYRGYLENLDQIPSLSADHGTLTVHFLLPDQYSAQSVRLSIRYDDNSSYEEVAKGVFKEMLHLDCFYSRLFLIAGDRTPTDIKVETSGFGGQGFTYFEIENTRGRFVPSAVKNLRGIVSDPENLLTSDWTWAFAGERTTKACYHNPGLAKAVHGFEIALKLCEGKLS